MTRHEKLLAEELLGLIGDASPEEALAKLFELGLLNRRACERRFVRTEVGRLAREGTPRCGAMIMTAEKLCCSYEKVRTMYYEQSNS